MVLSASFGMAQNQREAVDEFKKIQSSSQSFGVNALKYLENHSGDFAPGLPEKIVAEASKINCDEYREICIRVGAYFYTKHEMKKAYQYLYTALKLKAKSTTKSKADQAEFHKYLGFVFAYFERRDEALHHLNYSLSLNSLSIVETIKVYNYLGLIYRVEGDLVKAEKEFRSGYNLAKEANQKEWIGIIAGNIGHIAFMEGNYEEAKKLTTLDYQLSKEHDQTDSQVNALLLLMDIEMRSNGTSSIKSNIPELESLMENVTLRTWRDYYRFLKFYHEEIGEYQKALANHKRFQSISDSIEKEKDLLSISKFEFQMEFQKEFDQKQSELKILNEKRKQDQFRFYGIIIFLALLIVGAVIIVRLQIKRRQQEREVLNLQKSRIKAELRNSERELELMLSRLTEKRNLTKELKEKIDLITSDKDIAEVVDSLQSFTILTEEHWTDFKKIFNKVHPGFFVFLKKEYPELTPAETRFMTLIRLNLSKAEIANALGISPESVRKTSLRLRKKMNIDTHEELVKFILELGISIAG